MNEERIRSIHEVVDELYKWKTREDTLKEKLKVVKSQVKYYKRILQDIKRTCHKRAFIRFLRKLFR